MTQLVHQYSRRLQNIRQKYKILQYNNRKDHIAAQLHNYLHQSMEGFDYL